MPIKTTGHCIACGSSSVRELLDLGPQPPSNRYLASQTESCEVHPLRFGCCDGCSLAQLLDPMASRLVRSRFEWITYNEPEGHLDDLVARIAEQLPPADSCRILGITYKDDSTLARFGRRGFADTSRLAQDGDLGIADPLASLETIQGLLTPELGRAIASHAGQRDLVLVRHVLEHARDPRQLLDACAVLCKPGGLLVFEVPDCRKILDGHDHCFLWEEHICYFTPATLRGFFDQAGFSDAQIRIYPYPMEDSLIAIVRNSRSGAHAHEDRPDAERMRAERFADSFAARGAAIRRHFATLRNQGRRLALFGAGHLAAKFINFYDLAPYLTGVIDDNPNKLGRFMPGSKLPIIGSGSLDAGEIDRCFLTLNPESEQKVRKAKEAFLGGGGMFRSIFSASASSIDRDFSDDSA